MSSVSSMTPGEFRARWPAHERDDSVVLLDVREPHERTLATVAATVHIPMAQIPARLDELDADKTIVVMCHGGIRSLQVANYLAGNGFDDVVNLSGGIDAWSCEIDQTVPRY